MLSPQTRGLLWMLSTRELYPQQPSQRCSCQETPRLRLCTSCRELATYRHRGVLLGIHIVRTPNEVSRSTLIPYVGHCIGHNLRSLVGTSDPLWLTACSSVVQSQGTFRFWMSYRSS